MKSGMQRSVVLIVISSLFLIGCSESRVDSASSPKQNEPPARSNASFLTDCKVLLRDAEKMDSILMQQVEVDTRSAQDGIKAFADYANYCHNDSISPVYLIKCAQVARAINNIPQAKLVLDKCVSDYPSFKGRPAALFLLAQLYDEDTYLNNEAEARRLYEEIIENYPTSDWALSAKGAIGFLGKSDEEIMKELKKSKKNR
jgi:hypothetical protein